MIGLKSGGVDRLWIARAVCAVVDNIDDVALFEAGSSWVQSGTASGAGWRLELVDDYRDGTIDYVYWSADTESVRRLRDELRHRGIAAQQTSREGRPGRAISGVISEAAVRLDGGHEQFAQLLGGIRVATSSDTSPLIRGTRKSTFVPVH